MNQSESLKELAPALARAQSKIEAAKFDSSNPHFNAQYASLASCFEAIKPLMDEGFSVIQTIIREGSAYDLETKLLHSSTEWLSGIVPILIGKQDMQGLGSAVTYAKRYGISMLCKLASEKDDDGNLSVAQGNRREPAPRPQQAISNGPKIQPKNSLPPQQKSGVMVPSTKEPTGKEKAPPLKEPPAGVQDSSPIQSVPVEEDEVKKALKIDAFKKAMEFGKWTRAQTISYMELVYQVGTISALSDDQFNKFTQIMCGFGYEEAYDSAKKEFLNSQELPKDPPR